MVNKKKKNDQPVSITLDPALVREMEAEAQKTPEQRQADKDMLLNFMGNAMMEMGLGMISNPKKPAPSKPAEKPAEKNEPDPEIPDPDEYEF